MQFIYSEKSGIKTLEDLVSVLGVESVETFLKVNKTSMLIDLINYIDHDYFNRTFGSTSISSTEAHGLIGENNAQVMQHCGSFGIYLDSRDGTKVEDVLNKAETTLPIDKYRLVGLNSRYYLQWHGNNLICTAESPPGSFRKNLRLYLTCMTGVVSCDVFHDIVTTYTQYINGISVK